MKKKTDEKTEPSPVKTDEPTQDDVEFDFKDIDKEIDSAIDKQKKKMTADEYKIEHITDKIRFAKKIKENPPEPGFMDVKFHDAEVTSTDEYGEDVKKKGIAVITEHISDVGKKIKKIAVYDGIFNIDLNTDAYFWFVRSCNVFPLILDQGIRTHLDIKHAHQPEKRKVDIPWILIGLGIVGFIFIVLVLKQIFVK
jgi:hypothetical protein